MKKEVKNEVQEEVLPLPVVEKVSIKELKTTKKQIKLDQPTIADDLIKAMLSLSKDEAKEAIKFLKSEIKKYQTPEA